MRMSEMILKQVRLDPEVLSDRESMALYMKRERELTEWFGGNLDALADVLSEISVETAFVVEAGSLPAFYAEGRPKMVLKVISRAVQENPHLHLYIKGLR